MGRTILQFSAAPLVQRISQYENIKLAKKNRARPPPPPKSATADLVKCERVLFGRGPLGSRDAPQTDGHTSMSLWTTRV